MKNILMILVLIAVSACNSSEKKEKITSETDYNRYLATNEAPSRDAALTDIEFWGKRIKEDSTQLVEFSKLGGLHTALFSATGDVSELYKSETFIKKAKHLAAIDKDNYLRSLAHNYISQHRFKEAKVLLDSAYALKDNKRVTELMLFDVNMELGNYDLADEFLGKIKNNSDYNYLIRLSKWSDHKGDLDSAIRYMEQAMKVAESSGSKSLRLWTYSNIADYYGHAGRIQDAYSYYLKTLELQPDNAYVKKGIAWITYASEKNTQEANRILDSIMVQHKVPDYYLLKAEMAEYNGDASEAQKQTNNFLQAVQNANYGEMYNAYLIEIYADSDPQKALQMAEREVENRATPETYQLLAYAQLKSGDKEAALQTIETHVEGKTFEPKAAYCSALVYKANGLNDKVIPLKAELQDAAFELGPVMMRNVKDL
ncbi:tetratricopeptide repeat protein [Ulvibacter antarcticus]|uniref:Tetratricopeptide repeat protein n=1 Tax=Ulvibacter antarcticus TaxID=442714 RepID=A0A3L9YWK6_9FLAO|nr:tetratricopeptide repeat protein [Ulvibacter antarcticus]RMA64704.1 tetratricopeptide repeat protein [Ulvibacter antarcticus]